MFGPNVPMRKPLGFFSGVGQNALALVAEREIHGSRDFFANRGMTLDLLADRFNGGVRAQETVRQGLIFAQESQQQMLGLYIGRPELAGFVARKKDDASGFLRITFKHNALPPDSPV